MKKKLSVFIASLMAFVLLVGCSNSKISNNYITINKYKELEIKEVKKQTLQMMM